jgi:hypothetical protein
MFVDERSGASTYAVWIALEDITRHNGQLRVLRGSQRLDRSYRCSQLPPEWLQHHEVIEDRLESIPLRAGECVVLNDRVVRAAYANNTDRPRVVAAVSMAAAGAQLSHFQPIGTDEVKRVDVSPTFFSQFAVTTWESEHDPAAEFITVRRAQLRADELAARLDRVAVRTPLGRIRSVRRSASTAR